MRRWLIVAAHRGVRVGHRREEGRGDQPEQTERHQRDLTAVDATGRPVLVCPCHDVTTASAGCDRRRAVTSYHLNVLSAR